MKRAALIVTEADSISWDTYNDGYVYGVTTSQDTSEQLLADLRYLVELGEVFTDSEAAAARVRALLQKEGDEDE